MPFSYKSDRYIKVKAAYKYEKDKRRALKLQDSQARECGNFVECQQCGIAMIPTQVLIKNFKPSSWIGDEETDILVCSNECFNSYVWENASG